jgi:hypothetical protein
MNTEMHGVVRVVGQDGRAGARRDANGDISPASMVANHAIALLTVLNGVPERHDPDQTPSLRPAYQ